MPTADLLASVLADLDALRARVAAALSGEAGTGVVAPVRASRPPRPPKVPGCPKVPAPTNEDQRKRLAALGWQGEVPPLAKDAEAVLRELYAARRTWTAPPPTCEAPPSPAADPAPALPGPADPPNPRAVRVHADRAPLAEPVVVRRRGPAPRPSNLPTLAKAEDK